MIFHLSILGILVTLFAFSINFSSGQFNTTGNESSQNIDAKSIVDILQSQVGLIGFLGGLFSGIVTGSLANLGARYLWNRHVKPIIEIESVVVVGSSIGQDLTNNQRDQINPIQIHANRIRIYNSGKLAACNCKAFFQVNDQIELVGWMLSSEGHTITLNVHDKEYIDLCARTSDGHLAFRSTERGLPNSVMAARTNAINRTLEGVLRITSANAEEAEKRIRIDPTMNDPNDIGKMVQFLD